MLYTVVLEGAKERHSEIPASPCLQGVGQGWGAPLEMAVHTQGCFLFFACVLQVHTTSEAQLVLSQA